ncbi:MAG: hypothetical protein DME26_19605, partial [Verrucomicrobia bacterium]
MVVNRVSIKTRPFAKSRPSSVGDIYPCNRSADIPVRSSGPRLTANVISTADPVELAVTKWWVAL